MYKILASLKINLINSFLIFPNKIIFYIMSFFNVLFFHTYYPILTPLFFILSVLFIETIITIIFNPELTTKQQKSVKNMVIVVSAIFSAPLIIDAIVNSRPILLPTVFTFAILTIIIEMNNNLDLFQTLFKNTRNLIIISIVSVITFSFLIPAPSFFVLVFNIILLPSVIVILIRMTEYFPKFMIITDSEVEQYDKSQKEYNDRVISIREKSFIRDTKPIVISGKIYFYKTSDSTVIFDEHDKDVNDEIVKMQIKETIKVLDKVKYFRSKVFKKVNKLQLFLGFPISYFLNKKAMGFVSRWIYQNYEDVYFIGKCEEDKELHRNDSERMVYVDDFNEKIYNFIKVLDIYIGLPNYEISNRILISSPKLLELINDTLIPFEGKRIELAKRWVKKTHPKANEDAVNSFLKRTLFLAQLENYKKIAKGLENLAF